MAEKLNFSGKNPVMLILTQFFSKSGFFGMEKIFAHEKYTILAFYRPQKS